MEGLVSAGLIEGIAGVYAVKFRVPATVPDGTPRCGSGGGGLDPGVRSNLMVNIGYTVLSARPDRYDGAGICVAVQSAK